MGPITVSGNLVIARGGALMAAFGGGDVTVGGNVIVHQQGIAVLGCEPGAFACLDDPDQTAPTLSASFQVRGNVIATGSLAVLLHNGRIGRTLTISGGGGGVNCDSQPALMGSPAYATVEDVSIGRNVSITGWRSCWLGLFRTTVGGNVNFTNNVVADPDGNEVATDTIAGNLTCSHNSPAPQVGDSGGAPNAVGGRATGQCAKLTN